MPKSESRRYGYAQPKSTKQDEKKIAGMTAGTITVTFTGMYGEGKQLNVSRRFTPVEIKERDGKEIIKQLTNAYEEFKAALNHKRSA